MPPRHRLRPYFRPLRRGHDSVQLGLTAESGGLIVSGILPAEVALLERLVHPLTETEAYAASDAHGIPAPRATDLFALLAAHGLLLTDPPDLAPDTTALVERHVVVGGSGTLAWSIGRALRGSGVGSVAVGPWSADQAQADADRPDLVVVVADGVVDPRLGHPWLDRGVPLLPVVDDHHRVTVGPVVGPDRRLPCLRCLELARSDRDPARPLAVAQYAAHRLSDEGDESGGRDGRDGCDGQGVTEMAVGAVAMVAHTVLAGRPVPPGVSVELSAPWPRLDYRQWRRHDACPDHVSAPSTASTASTASTRGEAGVGPRDAPPRVTMTG